MAETPKNQEAAQSDLGSVSSSVDFWKDANEFLQSQLPPDFESKMEEYVAKKGYNANEFRLFKNMLQEAVGFYGTKVLFRLYL